MAVKKVQQVCPVSECGYTGNLASIAGHVSGTKDGSHDWNRLGYDGANHFKQHGDADSRTDPQPVTIGWLTDSHIGKRRGGYGKKRWEIQPEADFLRAIEQIEPFDPDAIVFTGDLFQNDEQGISPEQRRSLSASFERVSNGPTPVYYILGNHAGEDGDAVWASLDLRSPVIHLSEQPQIVGNTALYGVDYHPDSWWETTVPQLKPTSAAFTVLCLHQSVEPYRSPQVADFDLRTVLPKLCTNLDRLSNVVLIGHMHESIDDTISIDEQTVAVSNYGATTRIGKQWDSFEPGSAVITTNADEIDVVHPGAHGC